MRTMSPNTLTVLGFSLFWIVLVGGLRLAGARGERARKTWQSLARQWRPALAIAVVFAGGILIGQGVSGSSVAGAAILTPAIWCEGIVGLALARSLGRYEPLPVWRAIRGREHVLRQVVVMLLVALLVVVLTIVASALGTLIAHGVLRESLPHISSATLFRGSKLQAFFLLLSGAGIMEETLFRLVVLSLVWRLTRNRWVAIVLAAVVFGAYHLSPLDSLYLTFWQHPWTQFLSSTLSGLVLGYVYTWRGYETAVLGHTLSNWLPLLFATA